MRHLDRLEGWFADGASLLVIQDGYPTFEKPRTLRSVSIEKSQTKYFDISPNSSLVRMNGPWTNSFFFPALRVLQGDCVAFVPQDFPSPIVGGMVHVRLISLANNERPRVEFTLAAPQTAILRSAALSRDATRVASVLDLDGRLQIWAGDVAGNDLHPVADLEPELGQDIRSQAAGSDPQLDWLPNGRSISFLRHGSLCIIDVTH